MHRRHFLQSAGQIGLGALLLHSPLTRAAALANHQAKGGAHRALVCIYLAGGNDSFNLLVPRDSELPGSHYDTYRQSRGGVYHATTNPLGLAIGFNELRDLGTPPGQTGGFGLHPQCADYAANRNGSAYQYPGLATLFQNPINKLAFLANIGPLVAPVSKADVLAGAAVPPQLYSHSDQERLWHLAQGNGQSERGFAGRVLDAIGAQAIPISPCISVAGNARLLIGFNVFPYQLSPSTGVNQMQNLSGSFNFGDARRAALDAMLFGYNDSLIGKAYVDVFQHARDSGGLVAAALAGSSGRIFTPYDYRGGAAPDPTTGFYPDANLRLDGNDYSNPLLDQLRMIARMIRASRTPGSGIDNPRQVYYARLDGFDTHGDQFERHPLLIARLSQALGWFWQALGEIGAQDDVLTATLSDFGRTLSSNGDGSDHAWGGVQLVLGGGVDGGRIYGRYPDLVLDANNNASQDWSFSRGQYIPTVACEQLVATLATWLGVSNADLPGVFPNLGAFNGPLDFLA